MPRRALLTPPSLAPSAPLLLPRTQEFGIDILTDDTKTIVHHKVAAKVHLVLNAEDAVASSREINNWYRSAAGEQHGANMGRAQRAPRAPAAQNGLSFEHVLSRLQVRGPPRLSLSFSHPSRSQGRGC